MFESLKNLLKNARSREPHTKNRITIIGSTIIMIIIISLWISFIPNTFKNLNNYESLKFESDNKMGLLSLLFTSIKISNDYLQNQINTLFYKTNTVKIIPISE